MVTNPLASTKLHSPVRIATFNAKQAVDDFSMVVSYADIAAKNYSLRAGQYFDVKIEYRDLTPAQFAKKMQGFTDKLDTLFKESARLEKKIKQQLAGLRYTKAPTQRRTK